MVLNLNKLRPKRKYEHQDLIEKLQSRIAKANGATIEQFSLDNSAETQSIQQKEQLYKNADYINKNCTVLEDFIINDKINTFDLRKLADLNQIHLQISEAWYPLVIELIQELNKIGWNKKVSCIKEKFATLKFYISDNSEKENELYTIIEEFENRSSNICETCGENGQKRHNTSWEYVACRKHYLENRGEITVESSGFKHNGKFYAWSEIKDASFEDLNYNNRYDFLKIELEKAIVNHQGWIDNTLYLSKSSIGFGNFLSLIPERFTSLNYNYLKHFKNPTYCDVCGYKAVYLEECECCENEVWDKNNNWEEDLKKYQTNKERHLRRVGEEKYKKNVEYYKNKINNKDKLRLRDISIAQIQWMKDEGNIYESQQKNYPKNPDYKILIKPERLKQFTSNKSTP